MNADNNEISPLGSIFMHPSISTELYYLMEYNPEFCTHTIDVATCRYGCNPAIPLKPTAQHTKYYLMISILTISRVFLHCWIWLDAI
jgi:hypothetical protein